MKLVESLFRTSRRLSLALIFTAWAATEGHTQTVTGFSNGITQLAYPSSITAGPDGNLWFTEFVGNRIGRITPSGVVTEFSVGMSPEAGPLSIAAGPDGSLWFTEFYGNKIGRITTAGVITEFGVGIRGSANLAGITAGPDGNLWFAEISGGIGRITPTGIITEFTNGITGSPGNIALGPDGNLWFADGFGHKVGRMTPSGVATEFSAGISANASLNEITAGGDGNLWFTEGEGRIGRISTAGEIVEFSAGITPGSWPYSIRLGPDGNLWFTENGGGVNRIGRITHTGVVYEFDAGIGGKSPSIITPGPDGNLWFTDYYGNRIGRINLVTPPFASTVVEFYHSALDHYFITWVPDEIAKLDAGTEIKGWTRTGVTFFTYPAARPGTTPICRYYIPPGQGDSHFFGRGPEECDATGQKNPSFHLEDPQFMQMYLPTEGVCPANTAPIYRVFSNRADANHRYMTDQARRNYMVTRGWLAEGDGPDLVVMCAPQ